MAENKNRMNNEPVFGSLAYDLNTLNWEQLDGNAVRQPQEPLRRPERDIRPQREPRRRTAARLPLGADIPLRAAQGLLGLADGVAVKLLPVQGIQVISQAAEHRLVIHPVLVLRHGRAAPFIC